MSQKKILKKNYITPEGNTLDRVLSLSLLHQQVAEKVVAFVNNLPQQGIHPSKEQTIKVFEEGKLITQLVSRTVKELGTTPRKNEITYDFSFPTYLEFEKNITEIVGSLKLLPNPLFSLQGVMATTVQDSGELLNAYDPNGVRYWLGKLFGILGIGDAYEAIIEILEKNWPTLLKEIAEAIAKRDWKKLAKLFKKLLDVLISKEFFKKLVAKVGLKTATKIVGKILARAVPFIGWAVLIASLVWAIAEEFA